MSHVLFVTYYYPPEKGAAMVRISETAKRLVKLGHQVTVLTTLPNYPTGVVPQEYRGHLLREEMIDGVRVVRAWNYINSNTTFLRRIIPHLFFTFLAPLFGSRAVGRPDLIIVQSPPLFHGLTGRFLSFWKRAPFILWVSDLWPETPIQLGVLRNKLLIRIARWLEWSTYERARAVWVVAEGVRDDLIQRGYPPERIFLGINGVDTGMFHPLPQTPAQARAELGWSERFTVLYAGTCGVVHGLMTVLEAAKYMSERADIQFVFVGDGAQRNYLIEQSQKLDLKNVTFLAAQPHEQMPLVYAAADVCLVPARKAQVLKGLLPAKMFEIMACGRPFLLGIDGEARRVAEQEAEAALAVEPQNPEALVAGIIWMFEHPEQAAAMGKRGRAFAEERFDRDRLVAAFAAFIKPLLSQEIGILSAEPSPVELS